MVMTMNEILAQYEDNLTTYYAIYAEGLSSLLKEGVTSEDYLKIGQRLKSIAGGLGARTGKAGQRAKRSLVFNALLQAKNTEQADLTFHKVQQIARATTGRHFNNTLVHKHFSTQGRTSKEIDRTTMSEEQTQQLIHAIEPEVELLRLMLEEIRLKKSVEWQNSAKRKQIYRHFKKAQKTFRI